MNVVDSATVQTSQRIPYHVNVSFNDVMTIYRLSEQMAVVSDVKPIKIAFIPGLAALHSLLDASHPTNIKCVTAYRSNSRV